MAGSPSLVALYPGSFDPFHVGHLDVVEQALELFGSVIVAAMHNPGKPSGSIDLADRVRLIEVSTSHLAGVRVEACPGLAVDAARDLGADFIVKGLRSAADFDVEQQMADTNHSVSGVRTVFVPAKPDVSFVSSRFIREIGSHGGRIEHMLPAPIADEVATILRQRSDRRA
ncbi:MAG: pantetheine-phosphate adenylyltransferase [Actinomycetota bacterium]|nr:pantetheine-phosphate adenylyltransferase [Actinomycetota bacterium]MDA2971007.1 pantetheine-phosphate adenylyltransferase [Actinomycetota bacterium]MDA3000791.1 pantetheine-phosphate adenylyltransferase [Actinomycetota bacterium]